jgi:ABC-type thiamin/hydroxymethylpyrimidine transport system permease subunit
MMKFNTRELVTLAVFGVLWGIVEMSLGTVLKSLNVPMSGTVLAAIGLTVAMIGRLFVPRRGSTLFIGMIAMLLKLFSLGGVVVGPMIGIIGEAIIAELVLSLGGQPRRLIFMLAGGLGTLWPLAQPFITNPLLFGRSIMTVWLDLLDQGRRLLGLDTDTALLIVAALVIIRLLVGAIAGWFAWSAGHELQKRTGQQQAASQSL